MFIPLGNTGQYVEIDDECYGKVKNYKWKAIKSYNKILYTFYAVTKINRKLVRMHRLLLDLCRGEITDHIDCNGLNNKLENLRKCTLSQNQYNKRKFENAKHSSKYKGVSLKKGKKWYAAIVVNKKFKHLGTYDNEIDAAKAYNEAALEYFGQFARINVFT